MRLWLVSLIAFVFSVSAKNVIAEEPCVFILSGYGSSTSKELYQKIGEEYKKAGIAPLYIEIDWATGDILDYIAQARSYMVKCDATEKYFYGFSMGGLIALALAAEEAPVSAVVSSIAPFFEEDIERLAWYSPHRLYNWWLFGNSESISEKDVVSSVNESNTKVVLLVGSEEKEVMLKRSKSLAKELSNGELEIMKGIGHGISQTGHISYIVSFVED